MRKVAIMTVLSGLVSTAAVVACGRGEAGPVSAESPGRNSAGNPPAPESPPPPAPSPQTKTALPSPPSAPAPAQPAPEPAPLPAAAAPAAAACGEEGQPPCPLQGWMETHLLKAVEDRDLPAMAQGLEASVALVPDPAWNEGDSSWATLAREGATKARAGDFAGARASCKRCHTAWKDRYRREHRLRAVP